MDTSGPDEEGGVPPAGGPAEPGGPGEHTAGRTPKPRGLPDESHPFADLPPEWAALVIPDDCSALAVEAAQVRALLARERRRRRWHWLARLGHWQQYGPSAPLLGLVLLVAASFASLLVVVLPSGSTLAPPAPLARPVVAPGRDGGLLPDVSLTDPRDEPFRVRDLRPGVVLLVGDTCDCASLISEYSHATAEARVRLVVVGDQKVPLLPSDLARGRVVAATDPAGRLGAALDPPRGPDPVAVLVQSDGVIYRVSVNARNVVSLRTQLAALS